MFFITGMHVLRIQRMVIYIFVKYPSLTHVLYYRYACVEDPENGDIYICEVSFVDSFSQILGKSVNVLNESSGNELISNMLLKCVFQTIYKLVISKYIWIQRAFSCPISIWYCNYSLFSLVFFLSFLVYFPVFFTV